MFLGILALLGIGTVAKLWTSQIEPWLAGEWTHGATVALGMLFVSSFVALCGMEGELDDLRQEIKKQARANLLVFQAEKMDLRFGPSSRLTIGSRWDTALPIFKEIEREILSGNFSRSIEAVAMKDSFLDTVTHMYSSSAGSGFLEYRERFFRVMGAIDRHERELLDRE